MKSKPFLLATTGSTGDARSIDEQMLEQMAIRPGNRARYPKNWKAISLRIRSLAERRCEGWPDFPDCRAENCKVSSVTGSIILLTFVHRCHNTYDAPFCRAEIREGAFMDQMKLVLG